MTDDLLLLSPSRGFGGGIERVVDSIERSWSGGLARVDLYRLGREERAEGNRRAQVAFVRRALAAGRSRSWDRVLCLHAGLLPAAVATAHIARCPLVLVAYGTEVWAPMTAARRWTVRSSWRALAISTFTARWLSSRSGMNPDAIRLLELPIAGGLAERAMNADLDASREAVVLTVSRLTREHRYKGHFDIADAWPRIRAEQPGARWVVVGDGDDREALAARCDERGISHDVLFTGSIDDAELASWYRRASALALPSVADVDASPPTGEGFGLVYAEAGAFGVPSIASTAGGGALDYVQDRQTGLTVPSGNPERLADAVLELLANDHLRSQLGRNARQRSLAHHMPEQFGDKLRTGLAS